MSAALVPYVAPAPAQEVKVFDFEPTPGVHFHIRTVWFDGKPWFVAADVCRALGLGMSGGTSPHLQSFAKDEVCRTRFSALGLPKSDLGSAHVGPNTPINLISESGLYKLVMRSDKETARKFQDWAARHVFPGIRKDGMYVLGEEKLATGEERWANNAAHRPFRDYVVCGMMRQVVGAAHDARAFPSVGRAGGPLDRNLRYSVLAASGATMG